MKLSKLKSHAGNIRSAGCITAVVAAYAAAMPALATDYYWNPSVYEGFLSDDWYDTSSNPGKPGDGDCERVNNQRITSAGEYVLKVPTGGVYYDAAGTEVGNLPAGTKITFDATGATWVKQKTAGTAWGGGRIFNVQIAHHFFAIDSLNDKNANDWFGFTFQDGKMRVDYTDSGATFKLLSGTFNNAFLTDLTTASPHSTSILYTTSPGANVEFADGTTHLRFVNVIGQSAGGEFLISGGKHHIYGGLRVKTGAYGNSDGIMHISGGEVTLEDNNLWIGYNANGKGIVKVDGDGTFRAMGGTIYMPDIDNATGVVHVAGNGTFVTTDSFCAGHKNNSVAEFDVRGYGRLLVTNNFTLAEGGTYSSADLALSENAYVYARNLYAAGGEGRKADVSIADNATLEIGGNSNIGSHALSEVAFDMTGGHLVFPAGGTANFGGNQGGKVEFSISGGDMSDGTGGPANVAFVFGGGRGSTAEISGGDIKVMSLAVEGKQKSDTDLLTDWTNTVRQTGGAVAVTGGSNTGFDIRGNNRNAMYLLEDGDLTVNATYFRLGHGGANNGYHAVFRQTGGVFRLTGPNGINFCDAGGSDGEAEFLGGVSYVHSLRGWNGCTYRGGTGHARCYFNGGTIKPAWNDASLVYTMPECSLGSVGGFFDTDGFNAKIVAKFQNDGAGTENEAEGRFVKKGLGTLTLEMKETSSAAIGDYAGASLNSYHTYTQVDGGTLLLKGFADDAVDVAFGRNVIVNGGATLSLAGDARTLTVGTLTLGDGRGFAVLKLDADDTVVVEAADGIASNCGAIDPDWKSTIGEHEVFVCKNGVDADEVDMIAIFNADATKDYEWKIEVDSDTGYTVCSVVVAAKGTVATKTITYSEGAVTTNGTGKVSGIVAEVSGVQSGDIPVASAATVDVASGATLQMEGPIAGTGAMITKSGSGKLVVDGSNPEFSGSFKSAGGTLEITDVAAFGPEDSLYFPLVVGAGTLLYSDTANEAVFEGGLRIDGTAQKQSILRNEGDVTFKSVEYVSGAFTKTGKGTLTFDLPVGVYSLGSNSEDERINLSDGPTVLPASGEPPASNAGLGGVNFLEGTVKVKGEGVDKTTLQTRNTAILAGSVAGAGQTVLDLEDVQFKHGDGSRPGQVARGLPLGTPAPAFRLKNAKFWSDSLILGYSSSNPDSEIDIQMENSEFWPHYNGQIGSQTVAIRIDADNSQFHSDGLIGWGIKAKTFNADFYGEKAEMGTYSDGGTYSPAQLNWRAGIVEIDSVSGKATFRDGARFATSRGVVVRGTSTVDFEFDGGIFEIRKFNQYSASTSTWATVASKTTGFTTTGGGLELSIVEGFSHSIRFPIMGDGKVVKTGEGTFELVTPRAEGEKLLQYTGGTVVSNGTLVIDGSLVADGAKSFEVAEGAILDLNETTLEGATIAGAGVVTNGTLSAATIAYDADAVTTFSDVAFDGTLFVDFGKAGDESIDKDVAREGIVFAHYTGDAPAITKVKVVNTGIVRATAKVSFADGDIIVAVKQSGFEVRIR